MKSRQLKEKQLANWLRVMTFHTLQQQKQIMVLLVCVVQKSIQNGYLMETLLFLFN